MASRVNTKFVIGLSVVLLAAFVAVALVGVRAMGKSAADNARLGDEAAERARAATTAESREKAWTEAVRYYSQAVNKDQRNAPWIRKWIEAMEQVTPKDRKQYAEQYQGQYMAALRSLPDADRTDASAYKRFLDEQMKMLRAQPSRLAYWENFASETAERLKSYRGDEAGGKMLRRYLGIARVAALSINPEQPEAIVASARSDLEAALEADPTDQESVLNLATLDTILSERARRAGDPEAARRFMDAARGRLIAYAEAHPPAADARRALMRLELSIAAREAGPSASPADVLRDRQDLVQRAVDAYLAEAPEKTDVGGGVELAMRAMQGLPEGKSVADAILAHAAKGHPNDPVLQIQWAQLETAAGEREAALKRLQAVVDMPDKPLSVEGMLLHEVYRPEAMRRQVDVVLSEWERATTPTEREELRRRAAEYRDRLAARVGESSTQVLLVDAKLAFIGGDVNGARALLTRYNDLTSQQDVPGLMLLGEILLRQGNTGAAETTLERVLEIDPRNTGALLALSQVALGRSDYAEAYRRVSQAAAVAPEDARIAERLRSLEPFVKQTSDPIMKIVVEADRLLQGPDRDTDKAIDVLRRGVADHPDDPRLARSLVQVLLNTNDREGAKEAAKAAQARFPDDRAFATWVQALEAEDPVEVVLTNIGTSGATEFQKSLARYEVLTQAGRAEQAQQHLAAAAKIDPENPLVVEPQFREALRRGDEPEVQRLLRLAETKNLDQVNGAVYRARWTIVQAQNAIRAGKPQEAETSLAAAERSLAGAVERDKLNAAAWQLLGAVRAERGRHQQAAQAFEKAVEIRPDDLVGVTGLIKALILADEPARALSVARGVQNRAIDYPELRELWLSLEAQAEGGDAKRALEVRKFLASREPENHANRLQLARLLVEESRWAEARAEIDALRGKADLEGVTRLDATWHARQGNVPGALAAVQAYLDAAPADRAAEHVGMAARILAELNQTEAAAALLEAERGKQDPKQMQLDRQLGDLMFAAGQMDRAIAAYKRVLDAGSPDEGAVVAKRLVEALVLTGKHAQADEMLAAMGDRAKSDPLLLLLAADSASRQQDTARAKRLLDQAISADPQSAMAYLRRGEFNAGQPGMTREAEADFDQAARLRPEWPVPRMRLAELYFTTDRPDQGLEQLRAAVKAAPQNTQVRMQLLKALGGMGRTTELVTAVEEAVKSDPESEQWLLTGADAMVQIGRWDLASDYLLRIWGRRKPPELALSVVNALLSKSPPDVAAAAKVLQDEAVRGNTAVPVRAARARLLAAQGRGPDAAAELGQTLASLNPESGTDVQIFLTTLESIIADPAARLASLQRLLGGKPARGWLGLRYGLMRLEVPELASGAESDLRSLAESTGIAEIKVSVYRVLGSRAYAAGRHDEAVLLFRKGLEASPDDVEFNNNVAFALAKELGRPDEALPYAERAASLAPGNPLIMDTLGVVLTRLKRCDEAGKTLSEALAIARSDQEKLPLMVHLALAKLCQKNRDEAARLAEDARALAAGSDALGQMYGADLKELQQELDAH